MAEAVEGRAYFIRHIGQTATAGDAAAHSVPQSAPGGKGQSSAAQTEQLNAEIRGVSGTQRTTRTGAFRTYVGLAAVRENQGTLSDPNFSVSAEGSSRTGRNPSEPSAWRLAD